MKRANSLTIIKEPAPPRGKLGLSSLYAITLGMVLGAGVLTYLPNALAYMGKGAGFMFPFFALIGLLYLLPYIIMAGTLRLGGGGVSIVGALGGPLATGLYSVGTNVTILAMSSFGVSLGSYVCAVFTKWNASVVAAIAMTLFFVLNIFGSKVMSRIQNVLMVILLAGLLVYIIFGLMNISQPIFDFSSGSYFTGGFSGFLGGFNLLISCSISYYVAVAQGRNAKNATRDIPLAMLLTCASIFVLYLGVGWVTIGIAPIEDIAGTSLASAAKIIFPEWLYNVWMLVVPILLISTTLNSMYSSLAMPLYQSCKNGWFPEKLSSVNRFGAPWMVLTIIWIIGMIPIVLGLSFTDIVQNSGLATWIFEMVLFICIMRLPKKFPEAWSKSKFHMPTPVLCLICVIAMCIKTLACLDAMLNLTVKLVTVTAVIVVVCIVWSLLRLKTGKAKAVVSVWDPDDYPEDEAENI